MVVQHLPLAQNLKLSGAIPFVHGAEFVPTPSHSIVSDGFEFHSDVQALLKSAIRTSFPLRFVDDTRSVRDASVNFFVLHGAFEEAFATFASQETVMVAAHFVAADGTQLFETVLGIRLIRLSDGSSATAAGADAVVESAGSGAGCKQTIGIILTHERRNGTDRNHGVVVILDRRGSGPAISHADRVLGQAVMLTRHELVPHEPGVA